MAGDTPGELIVALPDGTEIYTNGILTNSSFFVGARVGVYNLSAVWDPQVGHWAIDDTAPFVTPLSGGSATFTSGPEGIGLQLMVSDVFPGPIDIGLVLTADGQLLPVIGASMDAGPWASIGGGIV